MKGFIHKVTGATKVAEAVDRLTYRADRVDNLISDNHREIMAKLQRIFEAIDALAINLPQLVNNEVVEIGEMIKAKMAGTVSEADLDGILDRLGKLGSTVGDSIVAIAPGLPSPSAPTPAAEPVMIPTPEPVAVPDIEIPVDVTHADLGVAGGVSIEAQ